MKGRMKWFWFAIIVYIFFTLPLLIANVLSVDWFGFAPGKADAWIGFWGSYLGGFFSSGAVIFTTWTIIIKERESFKENLFHREKERRSELFSNKTNEIVSQSRVLEEEAFNLIYAYRDILHESESIRHLRNKIFVDKNKLAIEEKRDFEKKYEKTLHTYVREEDLFLNLLRNLLQAFPNSQLRNYNIKLKSILAEFYKSVDMSRADLLELWEGTDRMKVAEKERQLENNIGKLHNGITELFQVIYSIEVDFEKAPTSQLEDDER
ncbi:hypothetical protein GOP80_06715 [Planococcaceae bacterium Storch 2/2-2]|nr:hypothetical protein [Planococcaceae bacterium Storch 2/2-2]